MLYILWMIIGYLSGSVLYGYLWPKLIKGIDTRIVSEDGNPGTYNAFKYAGKPVGVLVVICEVLKASLPVHLACLFLDVTNPAFALVLVAPVLGHGYSCFAHFKGGKCLGVSYGVLLGVVIRSIRPLAYLCTLYLFFSYVASITPHFCRSITIYSSVSIITLLTIAELGLKLGTLAMCLVVIRKHLHSMEGLKLRITWFPKLRKL